MKPSRVGSGLRRYRRGVCPDPMPPIYARHRPFQLCGDILTVDDEQGNWAFICTRAYGHTGRHAASAPGQWIVAVWP